MIKSFLIRPLFTRIFLLVTGLLSLQVLCLSAEDYSNLKITEISYHPTDYINGNDTIEGKDLEFIEFKNIGDTPINLTGLVLDSAVYYVFPNDIQLGAKQFWVIASKPSKFLMFYGVEPSGNFSGNLANSGDEILLQDAAKNDVIHFTYDDHAPWPESPDGEGYTLVSTYFNPTGNPADEAYWRASLRLNGSPFHNDDISGIDDREGLNNATIDIFPNPANDYLTINIADNSYSSEILVAIYKIDGSLVYQRNINATETIDLTGTKIESGLYLIRIETEKFIETRKLIISQSE